MGHAGAIISGSSGTAQAKKEALEAVGIAVGTTPTEVAELVAQPALPPDRPWRQPRRPGADLVRPRRARARSACREELADCARAVLERDGKTILSYGSGAGYAPLRDADRRVVQRAARRR